MGLFLSHMHKRNPYNTPIDFLSLSQAYPGLRIFLRKVNSTDAVTIDFKSIDAQRCLTEALLWCDFHLKLTLPEGRLCPPIPNRLNYILWIQDVLTQSFRCINKPMDVVGIDVGSGTGASAIYPLLGCKVDSSWKFVGTEIDVLSFASAVKNVDENGLQDRIKILKVDSNEFILLPFHEDPAGMFAFTMCNPPFYSDVKDIERSAEGKALEPNSVCTGAEVEMITPGGEESFVRRMVLESTTNDIKNRCLWYTSMLGKLSSVERIVETFRTYKIDNYALTELVQGQTRRWVIAWSFSDVRLPDNLARGLPFTHHALLPSHNSLQQIMPKVISLSGAKIREILKNTLTVLKGVTVQELPEHGAFASADHQVDDGLAYATSGDSSECIFLRVSANQNSWSRAARRSNRGNSNMMEDKPTTLLVDVSALRKCLKGEGRWILSGTWRRGKDRGLFESFWSHTSRKVCSAVKALVAKEGK